MTDDPREILKAAGVECAEVERIYASSESGAPPNWTDDAILALARLVAKYKWQRDEGARWLGVEELGSTGDAVIATLGHLWDLR